MEEYPFYDAFVCYADEDIYFVSELVRYLESEELGFRLFFRKRDMLEGHSESETSMHLIQERSKKVLIILSPDFVKCPACEVLVQASFVIWLGKGEKRSILIPLVYKACEIPYVLKFLTRIDFTKPGGGFGWNWGKLISSLQDDQPLTPIPSDRRNSSNCKSLLQLESPDKESPPLVTFPAKQTSLSVTCNPTACSSTQGDAFPSANLTSWSIAGCSSSPPSPNVPEDSTPNSTANFTKPSVEQRSKLQKSPFWKLLKKKDPFHGGQDYSTSISSPNATSGFHSQTAEDSVKTLLMRGNFFPSK